MCIKGLCLRLMIFICCKLFYRRLTAENMEYTVCCINTTSVNFSSLLFLALYKLELVDRYHLISVR